MRKIRTQQSPDPVAPSGAVSSLCKKELLYFFIYSTTAFTPSSYGQKFFRQILSCTVAIQHQAIALSDGIIPNRRSVSRILLNQLCQFHLTDDLAGRK